MEGLYLLLDPEHPTEAALYLNGQNVAVFDRDFFEANMRLLEKTFSEIAGRLTA